MLGCWSDLITTNAHLGVWNHAALNFTSRDRRGGGCVGWVRFVWCRLVVARRDAEADAGQCRYTSDDERRHHCRGGDRDSRWSLPCPACCHRGSTGVGTRSCLHPRATNGGLALARLCQVAHTRQIRPPAAPTRSSGHRSGAASIAERERHRGRRRTRRRLLRKDRIARCPVSDRHRLVPAGQRPQHHSRCSVLTCRSTVPAEHTSQH